MGDRQRHWEGVFATRQSDEVSWYRPEPSRSLALLGFDGQLPRSVIDVGAGDSPLVDQLLAAGVEHVTVLDVSAAALRRIADRLGADDRVDLVRADITDWTPERRFGAWHDRAVLHFLIEPDDRAAYATAAAAAVEPGGLAVLGAFAIDGPDSCSGLPVVRYDAAGLAAVLGHSFELIHSVDEVHHTPWGAPQHFVWAVLRRHG